jgi:hypothetical protein
VLASRPSFVLGWVASYRIRSFPESDREYKKKTTFEDIGVASEATPFLIELCFPFLQCIATVLSTYLCEELFLSSMHLYMRANLGFGAKHGLLSQIYLFKGTLTNSLVFHKFMQYIITQNITVNFYILCCYSPQQCNPKGHLQPQRRQSAEPFLQSLALGLPHPLAPHPQASVPPPPLWFRGEGLIRLRERGWGVPIPTRVQTLQTLWYSRYIRVCTLCL